MLQKSFMILLLGLLPFLPRAQESGDSPTLKEQRKSRSGYLGISWGLDFISFRDLATSPRYYTGTLQTVALESIRSDDRRYSNFGVRGFFGNASSEPGFSEVRGFFADYARLYQVEGLSSKRWNFKAGGTASVTGNQRINRSFGNAGQGLELFGNLMASGRLKWDVSRSEGKRKKFLFIKYYLPQRPRSLVFQLNLGLVNGNFRNGFSYIGQSGALNTPRAYDDYEWNFFAGFRAGTMLAYTVFLNNGNGLRLSYHWDAYTTGGDINQFAMGHHFLQFSVLFNTK